MNYQYKNQVVLLLKVLPEVAKESCFALHGGTAINLFLRNMPRLSVDIDLTYVIIEERSDSLKHINDALERIKRRLGQMLPQAHIDHLEDRLKLTVSAEMGQIKIEVNQIGRGVLSPPVDMVLCKGAQEEFDVFCSMPVVPVGQLFGGKICAALDRQHPRDLFDVKYLLEKEGVTTEIKEGFFLSLLGSNRPTHELIAPTLLDQRKAMDTQFSGMTREVFTYEDFENTRSQLISQLRKSINDDDKEFLVGFNSGEPDWSHYNLSQFPSIRWKLQNLEDLKSKDPDKHLAQLKKLKEKLG